ncbi:peptide-methionine (S)-S-oxide reductase MsrA [Clostridium thermobutyricum]|uniref:Peptide methionine sulfoxide reductase MsrA n=1 Tax=Clostridium thermobutyricum DSM 4928 TaxID=1121339 RepID=A0A1V4SZG2_9CLOT|nr:peptide-methionine (S)-S-oxide reductase MsrA [Clostridium thermobutyricum]OPX49917.1 peptide methionine sulfoxide reductase MsrA/MsrB [Clostridium thermobutyricum DSM 4928]
MKEIVLAGGCFWGVEEFMSRLDGVISTEVGYANGRTENPSYEDICTKDTGYAEVCKVTFNEDIISLRELLIEFWGIINPTVLNRQGNDIGSQYRTGIYYTKESDIDTIILTRDNEQEIYTKPIVTEIKPLISYYKAEEYHQHYLKKNPNGYCHIELN